MFKEMMPVVTIFRYRNRHVLCDCRSHIHDVVARITEGITRPVERDVMKEFTNELGNKIRMNVVADERGITVEAESPTSLVEHTWTPMEAKALREMLESIEKNQVV